MRSYRIEGKVLHIGDAMMFHVVFQWFLSAAYIVVVESLQLWTTLPRSPAQCPLTSSLPLETSLF
jgi:hypothetical protein